MPILQATQTPLTAPQTISFKDIWVLTWPQLLMMLFQFLVGFTDVWVAGRINPEVQAALGLVTQCLFFFMVIGIAIANAATSTMSQSLGANKQKRTRRYLGMVINLGIFFCVITLLIGFSFSTQILKLLHAPEEMMQECLRLWQFFLCAIPFQYAMSFSGSAFRAYKKVHIPLYTGIVVCSINFILDMGLGLGYGGLPRLGVDGLALGTVISTACGAVFSFYMLYANGYLRKESFAPIRWQRKAIGYLTKVALPAGGNQFSWQLGYLFLFGITASLPNDSVNALAGMAAGMRIESILFLPAIAFSMTGTVLVGYCLGHGYKLEAKKVGLKVLLAACASMSLAALLLWPFVESVSAFMSPAPAVLPHTISYISINLFSTPFTVGSMTMAGLFTGAGASIYPFVVYGAATWLIRLPLAWLLGHLVWQSSSGVFLSMLISQIVQFSIIIYIFLCRDWTRFAMYHHKHA
ncbi:MAG: MATE family efflux transporter [Deltaproteobacteria bacterium]|jgi:MATE family multidrug resistance protein|nr:MATE family efflux transporter [Deltaproteobacteria bacterium]